MSDLVVLLSGGLDSTVAAEIARQSGHLHSVVSFCYGQANTVQEMSAADRWATRHKVTRKVFTVDVPGVSALDIGAGTHGPRVVPGRNLLLLSHAVAYALSVGACRVWIGCNADDAEDYPDCRRDFIEGVGYMTWNAYGLRVWAPLVDLTKRQVVAKARELGIDIADTWSCYQPSIARPLEPCGTCNACRLRIEAGA